MPNLHLNNIKIADLAKLLIEAEVSQQIGEVGKDNCLAIAISLREAARHFGAYLVNLQAVSITPEAMMARIDPASWAKLTPRQREMLWAQIVTAYKVLVKETNRQRTYLADFAESMDALGEMGKEAIEARLREMTMDGMLALPD